MTNSVDGLISGLSTSTLISQLMQIESQGKTRLQSRVTAQENINTAFQTINTKVAALKTAATDVMSSTTWSAAKASSSSEAVTATASAGATTGRVTFNVDQLAQAALKTVTLSDPGSITATGGGDFSLTVGGTTTNLTAASASAADVVSAINNAKLGVSASLISTAEGTTVLQLVGNDTGLANDFTLGGLVDTVDTVTEAQDAKISVGTVGLGGYTIASSSNTFTNLLPNVSITATEVANDVTVSVGLDSESILGKVQALVDAANELISGIGSETSIKTASDGSTSSSTLAGNSMVRQLQTSVLSAVSVGASGYGSFSQLGLETSRDGTITFDAEKFTAAYEADPAQIQSALAEALGQTFQDLATTANTNITSAIQSGTGTIRTLNDQIDSWTVRLATRQEALQKQFANLEVALGKLQNQSTWLAGQISTLNTSS